MSEPGERGHRGPVDRRTMLKAAVATSAGVAAWTAPDIKTVGFARAAAQTGNVIQSDDFLNSNDGGTSCPDPNSACCGQTWGNNGQQATFTFVEPVSGCGTVVVELDTNDPNASPQIDPDIAQVRAFISSNGGCNCLIEDALMVVPGGGPNSGTTILGSGPAGEIDISISVPCDDIPSSAQLFIRISCV